METAFTPWASLAGGALIGLAAVALMAVHGRIMGATGLLAGLLYGASPADRSLRTMIVIGMACGPVLHILLTGAEPVIAIEAPTSRLIASGLIVGFGASIGGGCTSGHGVCGVARLSRRSIIATLTFMAACAATVFLLRHGLG